MTFDILTIFPKIFASYFQESMIKRAQVKGKIKIKIHNLRDFTFDQHRTTDALPYGGGPGMVMKVEPIYRALQKILPRRVAHVEIQPEKDAQKSRVILLSARGKILNQKQVEKLARFKKIVLICGHYEGVDERVSAFVDEQISIGRYVLTGGELPAMVIVDAVSRLLPGVLGNQASLQEESFSPAGEEYPQYTRPAQFHGLAVPKVLLSGDHQAIRDWRQKQKK